MSDVEQGMTMGNICDAEFSSDSEPGSNVSGSRQILVRAIEEFVDRRFLFDGSDVSREAFDFMVGQYLTRALRGSESDSCEREDETTNIVTTRENQGTQETADAAIQVDGGFEPLVNLSSDLYTVSEADITSDGDFTASDTEATHYAGQSSRYLPLEEEPPFDYLSDLVKYQTTVVVQILDDTHIRKVSTKRIDWRSVFACDSIGQAYLASESSGSET